MVNDGLLDSVSEYVLVIRCLQRKKTVGGFYSSSYVDINYIVGACQVEVEAKV